MTLRQHLAAATRYDVAARCLDEARRFAEARGNAGDAERARENRDVARRLHLDAVADALAAGWVVS